MFPVEAFRNTLNKFVAILRSQNIPFHLTGGITSVYYGEPRMTQDIDIVVDNSRVTTQMDSFLSALESSEFVFDKGSVRIAIQEKGMFQLLDSLESLKLDIYPRELIPGELQRSVEVEVFEGEQLPIASRIDAIVSKLIWVNKGSHKSRRDVRRIFENASQSEKQLAGELAEQLKLSSLLAEILNESDEIS